MENDPVFITVANTPKLYLLDRYILLSVKKKLDSE